MSKHQVKVTWEFYHREFDLGPRQAVKVWFTPSARVMLLTPGNFQRYRRGQACDYYHSHDLRSPVTIYPGRSGHYHLVVDLNGRAGQLTVKANIVETA